MTKYSTYNRKLLSGDASFIVGTIKEHVRNTVLRLMCEENLANEVSDLQNDIKRPEEYGSTRFILIGPHAEIGLHHNIWWTTFLQYKTEAENFNINSRGYRPMSDLFVVTI